MLQTTTHPNTTGGIVKQRFILAEGGSNDDTNVSNSGNLGNEDSSNNNAININSNPNGNGMRANHGSSINSINRGGDRTDNNHEYR